MRIDGHAAHEMTIVGFVQRGPVHPDGVLLENYIMRVRIALSRAAAARSC